MPATLNPAPGSHLVIIGGTGGIGRALVAAARAMHLEITVLDLPRSLADNPPPMGVPTREIDVTSQTSVQAAFAGLPPIHALVNLAGFTAPKCPLADQDPATWNAVIDANLTGAWHVARTALPLLHQAARPGSPTAIVHAASGLAARVLPGYAPYAAAKAGLIALTKAIAAENAPNVRANAIAPGAVDTEFLRGGAGRPNAERPSLDIHAYAATIPMRRIAQPTDIAAPILFLCGPGSAYMTGQTLWINGGALTP